MSIHSVIGGVITGVAGDEAAKAARDWRNAGRSSAAIRDLFHQVAVNEQGLARDDTDRFEVAGMRFVVTSLNVDGLVQRPVYAIEVTNTELPGDDPHRVRHFAYDSASFAFWLERPTSDYLISSPSAWPPISDGKTRSAREADKEAATVKATWFQRPLATSEKAWWAVPYATPTFAVLKGITQFQDKKLAEKIHDLLQAHSVRGDYVIAPDRLRFGVDDLTFWLTPLKNGVSESRTASYYVIVRHDKLQVHAKRVVAFRYRPGTKLQWI